MCHKSAQKISAKAHPITHFLVSRNPKKQKKKTRERERQHGIKIHQSWFVE